MSKQSKHQEPIASNAIWYLGIDFGTTGLSAALLNYSTGQRSPIYWSQPPSRKLDKLPTLTSSVATHSSDELIFRLPTAAYFGVAGSKLVDTLPNHPTVAGSSASQLANDQAKLLLDNFKSCFNIGIPYYFPKRQQWEPTLQLPPQQSVSLYGMRRALQTLLATLTPNSTVLDGMMSMGAKGLEMDTLITALQKLQGVIIGCPAAWGDTYRFNLREAVLGAKLVQSPEQIFFLEDAIACVLASLPSSGREADKGTRGQGNQGDKGDKGDKEEITPGLHATSGTGSYPLSSSPSSGGGGTLVINAGASTTELALVDLPDDLQDLTYSDFSLCSLSYAGNAVDQDIFCQLLYPQLSLEQQQQLSLNDDWELPSPGQPDPQRRDRLAFLLQRSSLGQGLIKAAGCLKIILQHKEQFTLDLGKQQCTLRRLDLEESVIEPFVQLLSQTLNTLLLKTGISEQGIYQVLLLGGTASLSPLTQWIQKRLPNATIIRNSDAASTSCIAVGLATLPLYPQVLNHLRHQYSDYFLLLELLRAFPETRGESVTRSYSLQEIMQQLERRGLNTAACYERLVRLVEGQLPDGLVPSTDDTSLLSATSKQILLDFKVSERTELFSREDNQVYRRNPQQQEHLQEYLELALSGSSQTFKEPLLVTWGELNKA